MRRMPFFFEPLRAWRDTTWDVGYKSGPPRIDDEEVVGKWWSARDKAEGNAKVVIFGSGLREPSVVYPLTTGPHVYDGSGIVATVHPLHHDHPKGADHVQFADRIVECVNACAGMPHPAKTLAAIRELLQDLFDCVADATSPRILSLLDQLIPSEEYALFLTGKRESEEESE